MPYNALYIGSKWCDAFPDHGINTDGRWGIIDTLEATSQAKCQWFAFDEYYAKYKKPGDEALIKLCENNKFDFIILDWMNGLRIPHKDGEEVIDGRRFFNILSDHEVFHWLNPTHETLDVLSHKLNIPITGIAWDTVDNNYIAKCEELVPYLKFHVIVDCCFLLYITKNPSHYLVLWGARNTDLFYDQGEEAKDIPISFLGRLSKPNTNREEAVNRLKDNGIDLFHAGGQRESTKITHQEYASLMRRSKITVNLPASASGISQLTSKPMEATLSGVLLLEEMNLETTRLFAPMEDYVPFWGMSDLCVKARYFMHHEDQRREIAQRGHDKAVKHYTNRIYWNIILDNLGLSWE